MVASSSPTGTDQTLTLTVLRDAEAAVVMKLGRNFEKVRRVLRKLGLDDRAHYVERATMASQKIVPLDEVEPMDSPYFSMILVPGQKWRG